VKPGMRVVVTRPERDAQSWVQALLLHGFDALALPLIAIYPARNQQALIDAWQQLLDGRAGYRAVMFVSGHAVDHFFASKPPLAPVFSAQAAIKTRAWATGPGTARTLLAAGVEAICVVSPPAEAGQFDSEALWAVVQADVRPGDRVLIVRGGDASDPAQDGACAPGVGRDWLARRLMAAGASADFLLSYQRGAPRFSAEQRSLAQQAATDGSVWLFSSSEAVANLRAVLPDQDWTGARAVATHPRIAAAARKAGFGVVFESRPLLPEIIASIESMV
jgi:uroporphyrinogen-III synthase